jgi:pimeloyl-ACP methyl ester carboxylesterase
MIPPARIAALPDVNLTYRDSGGGGSAVVLLHAATGSADVWEHQFPAFVAAGHRVISYSRRGHAGSTRGEAHRPGTPPDDLRALLDLLGVARFHAVGVAAGGGCAADYALSYPAQVLSLTLASSLMGLQDEEQIRIGKILRPDGFREMPPEFRELSGSYLATNPDGVARWRALEHAAAPGGAVNQPAKNRITVEALARLTIPMLLLTGESDMYMPPALLRRVAGCLPDCEIAVFGECAHAPHWEQPERFNATLLDFLARRGGAMR